MMCKVVECANESTNVVVGIGYEEDFSASAYLEEKYNIKNVYNLFYTKKDGNKVIDGYRAEDNKKSEIVLSDAQMFIGYLGAMGDFMEEHNILEKNFEEYIFGDYVLYVKK